MPNYLRRLTHHRGFNNKKFTPRTVAVGSLILLAVFTSVGTLAFFWKMPSVAPLKMEYPVVRYLGPNKTVQMAFQKNRPVSWTPLREISLVAVGAIIVSEDWAFFQHSGLDTNQITEAIKKDWENRRFARGASTITQQVVRNVFLDQRKTILRKLREIYLAIQVEKYVGKRKILETYVNIVEWGPGVYGIKAAARYYFNKEPKFLTAKEGAFLAMLLPSPKRYSQSFRFKQLTPYAQKTVVTILEKMVMAQYLSQSEFEREISTPLVFEQQSGAIHSP